MNHRRFGWIPFAVALLLIPIITYLIIILIPADSTSPTFISGEYYLRLFISSPLFLTTLIDTIGWIVLLLMIISLAALIFKIIYFEKFQGKLQNILFYVVVEAINLGLILLTLNGTNFFTAAFITGLELEIGTLNVLFIWLIDYFISVRCRRRMIVNTSTD